MALHVDKLCIALNGNAQGERNNNHALFHILEKPSIGFAVWLYKNAESYISKAAKIMKPGILFEQQIDIDKVIILQYALCPSVS